MNQNERQSNNCFTKKESLLILVTQFIKSNSIVSMLTQQSFVAIDRFLPFIQPMKAILQPFYQHLDSQQVTFQITRF